jgi:hypothetical protein
VENKKVLNNTVVHFLQTKENRVQHRDVFDKQSNIRLNYSSEYEGILMYLSINKIPDESKIRYLATSEFLELFDRLEMMDIDVRIFF